MSAYPWIALAVVAAPVAGKIIISWLALRSTEPAERPAIIRAVAELFRWSPTPRTLRRPRSLERRRVSK